MIEPPDGETVFSTAFGRIVRWAIAVSCLVLGLLLIVSYGNLGTLFHPDIGSKIDAYLTCRQLVSDRLRTPVVFAENPTSLGTVAVHLGGGRWQLRGVVESSNKSGSTSRTDYTCILQLQDGGQWQAEQVTLTPRPVIP